MIVLVVEDVEVRWHPMNRHWYESKGYSFTKHGEQLVVKSYDIPHGSDIKIKYKCDKCKKVISISKKDYINAKSDTCTSCNNTPGTPKLSFDIIQKAFRDKGYILVSTYKEYKNSHSKLKYTCTNADHGIRSITYHDIKKGNGCKKCNSESKTGSNSPFWRGGITQLSQYLRQVISPWVSDSMKQCNFKCILTNESKAWHVHHITSFNTIVTETLEYLCLPIKPIIGDYTEQEITLINNKCLQLHYDYGLGVCVREDLHTLFHCHYGYGDNTEDQWNSFVSRWKAGEFNVNH